MKKIGVNKKTAKPHISSKSISEIIDEVSSRHRKSLDKLAKHEKCKCPNCQ